MSKLQPGQAERQTVHPRHAHHVFDVLDYLQAA